VPEDEREAGQRERMAVLALVAWPLVASAGTVALGMRKSWPFWAAFAPLVAAVIAFGVLARAVVGPGWTRFLGIRRTEYSRLDAAGMVVHFVGLMVIIVVGNEAKGDLPALVLGGLLAGVPLVVWSGAVRWWWQPRAAARARCADDRDAD
jgi:hypothetical protein